MTVLNRTTTRPIASMDSRSDYRISPGVLAIIAGGGAIISAIAMYVLASADLFHPSTLEFFAWVGGFTIIPPATFMTIFEKEYRRDRNTATNAIMEALNGLTDETSKPTPLQINEIIQNGTTIPLTVNGVSGAEIVLIEKDKRLGTRHQSVVFDSEFVTPVEFHVAVKTLDDGTDNFKRLIKSAIEDNPDIAETARYVKEFRS